MVWRRRSSSWGHIAFRGGGGEGVGVVVVFEVFEFDVAVEVF